MRARQYYFWALRSRVENLPAISAPGRCVIPSGVARVFFRAICARRAMEPRDLSSTEDVAWRYIQERFLDCVSRRFAQRQRRGTLRSE